MAITSKAESRKIPRRRLRSRAKTDWKIRVPSPGQPKTVSTTTEPPSKPPNWTPAIVTTGRTNAGLEAVNAVVQWVKKTARGFRNPEHFKITIYFHCGGLDLYPRESR